MREFILVRHKAKMLAFYVLIDVDTNLQDRTEGNDKERSKKKGGKSTKTLGKILQALRTERYFMQMRCKLGVSLELLTSVSTTCRISITKAIFV